MKGFTVSFTAAILVLSGFCFEVAGQSGFGSTVSQSQNTGGQTPGTQTSGFGSGNTPFGGMTSSGEQGQSRAPFSGTDIQGGIFGGAAGNLMGAVGLGTVFSQGQNPQTARTSQFGPGGGFNNFGVRGLGRAGNLGNRNNQRLRGGGRTSQIVYRTQFTLGFNYPQITDTRLTQRLQRQLDHQQLRPVGGPSPKVAMAATERGTVAVLRGTVATEEARLLAEQIVLLHPGISAVQNELTVNPVQAPQTLQLPGPVSDSSSPR